MKSMLKPFTHFFACLLLVLVPLQALATANMLICNSMMQSVASKQLVKQIASQLPCHKHSSSLSVESTKHSQSQKTLCKSNCATVCANLCALTAATNNIKPSFMLNNSQTYDFNQIIYVSITQVSPQRPPNFFI